MEPVERAEPAESAAVITPQNPFETSNNFPSDASHVSYNSNTSVGAPATPSTPEKPPMTTQQSPVCAAPTTANPQSISPATAASGTVRLPPSLQAPALASANAAATQGLAPPPTMAARSPAIHSLTVHASDRTIQHYNDDDISTDPSSTGNTYPSSTRMRHTDAISDDEDDDDMMEDGVLLCGYLQKLGRNGKWQTRWFETDGECLSYYKNKKRSKLLATLDLEKVGNIEIDRHDQNECSFSIQVLGRKYELRAESRASCKDWVIMLNRVKEARLQQGNVKLINHGLGDLLSGSGNDVTPRVVVVANRERTRAVEDSSDLNSFLHNNKDNYTYDNSVARRSAIGSAVLARWTKRKSTLARLSSKLARWARSMRKYGCAEVQQSDVQLDRYVHPPGHASVLSPKTLQTSSNSTSSGEPQRADSSSDIRMLS